MLDVGDTHAHGGEGKDTDGEEHATVKHGAHPDAVLHVRFSAAHSSAPLASADHSFSFEGRSVVLVMPELFVLVVLCWNVVERRGGRR